MCDYSLHTVASGPAKVGDKLVKTMFEFSRGVSPRPSPIGKRTVLVGELFEPGLDQLLPRHTSARLLRRNDPALVPSNLNIDHRSRARTDPGMDLILVSRSACARRPDAKSRTRRRQHLGRRC